MEENEKSYMKQRHILENKKFLVSGILIYLSLFAWRFLSLKPQALLPGTQVEIISVLDSEPEVSGRTQQFKAAGLRIKTRRYPEYHYGDKLKILGTVGQYQSISFPVVTKLEAKQTNFLKSRLFQFRFKLEEEINKTLPPPQSSLFIGMLLGIKNLPYDFSSDLKRSGLIHIVVASGSNVTIVASFFLYLSGFIKRRSALLLSLLAIVFYTLMIGAEPPIVRAALMGGLSYLAKIFGRQPYQLLTLVLVACLMLLYNPFYFFDLSFQLSFLATAGIILFAPIFLEFLKGMRRELASAIATTVSAQLFVTPLIVYKFGQFPLFSLITNILVYPIVEPVMILGFPFAIFGTIVPIISRILSLFLWLPLTYFVWVTHFFGNLNFSLLNLPKLPFLIFFPYYLFLFHFWHRHRNQSNNLVVSGRHDRGSERQEKKGREDV